MGALKRATKREREREKWEQSSKPKNLGQKKKTLTLNSQALCDKNKERSGLKAPKRGREVGALKRATKREREREKWEQSSKPKNLGQKKKTLTLNSQALCDKNKERSGLKAPKRGREVGALKRATKREREREVGAKLQTQKLGAKEKNTHSQLSSAL